MTVRSLIAPLRLAQRDFGGPAVRHELDALLAPGATVHLGHPFEDLDGAAGFAGAALAPLAAAFPDLERRDLIVMDGTTKEGAAWIGCGGYWTGTFARPFLDIPPTGHQAAMRFHEFYRVEDGARRRDADPVGHPRADAAGGCRGRWRRALGREWHVPGPATQDGLAAWPGATGRGPRRVARSSPTCSSTWASSRARGSRAWRWSASGTRRSAGTGRRASVPVAASSRVPELAPDPVPERAARSYRRHLGTRAPVRRRRLRRVHRLAGDEHDASAATVGSASPRRDARSRCGASTSGAARARRSARTGCSSTCCTPTRRLGVDVFARVREFNKARTPRA